MVRDENKIRARKDWHMTKVSAKGKSPRPGSCAENQREIILCLEAKKKEAAKPLYLLRYE
jgi:hypothetical protein